MEYIKITENMSIEKPSDSMAEKAKAQWDAVAKPLDGLGKLEDLICKIASIQGTTQIDISKRAVLVMCADNGIVEEGVTQSGQDITAIVAGEMAKGRSSVCMMARPCNAKIIPIDIGILREDLLPSCAISGKDGPDASSGEMARGDLLYGNGLIRRKIAEGTKNFLQEEAMTKEQMWEAIQVGANLVADCKDRGYTLLATGEMGIGNTTTSSALASALLQMDPEITTGRGAGLSNQGLARKVEVIREGLRKYGLYGDDAVNVTPTEEGAVFGGKPNSLVENPLSKQEFAQKTLQSVGGLDIAGLVGVFLGGALYRVPIVIDGLISAVAALVAEQMFPGCAAYMLPAHMGQEPAIKAIMDKLELSPVIHGNLALGEGTGAILLFPLLDAALPLYKSGTGFDQMEIEQYERF